MTERETGRAAVMRHLSVVFLTWRRYRQRQIATYSITLKQLHVLGQLEKKAFLYPSQIAEMLFCDRPTATVVIKNMEKQGWITRQRDPQDQRQTRVMISGPGRAKLVEIREAGGAETIDPLACLSKEEIEAFDRMLVKMDRYFAETIQN